MSFRVAAEVIRTLDVEADMPSDGKNWEPLKFRIEFLRCQEGARRVTARIWRQEFYRIQPTFPQSASGPAHEPCDELILVEETSLIDPKTISYKDCEQALTVILATLNDRLLGTTPKRRKRKQEPSK